jgi:hypothetical protein
MRLARPVLALACLLACLAFAACGGSGGDSSAIATSKPAPPASDFPSAQGQTLHELLQNCSPDAKTAGERQCGPATLAVSPASQVFYKGENRVSFGVFEFDRTPVSDAKVALYIAPVPPAEATGTTGAPPKKKQNKGTSHPSGKGGKLNPAAATALDQPASGPFPASIQTLATEAAFRSQTSSQDPDAATTVYTAGVTFPKNGEWRIAAIINDGGKLTSTLVTSVIVGEFNGVPRVGQRPPRIHTPTLESVGGDPAKLTTRVPPETQNQVDFYDALGKDPIVLLFATPEFCQSRVCGPVVDVAEQVREESPDDVKFIHMEIYNNNQPNDGVRPQVRAFNLPSEPWVFVIDRQGIIRTAIEGAFSVDELEKAVKAVS